MSLITDIYLDNYQSTINSVHRRYTKYGTLIQWSIN